MAARVAQMRSSTTVSSAARISTSTLCACIPPFRAHAFMYRAHSQRPTTCHVARSPEQVSESVTCLNESTAGAAKAMLGKGWCHKLDEEPFLESDADEQVRLLRFACIDV